MVISGFMSQEKGYQIALAVQDRKKWQQPCQRIMLKGRKGPQHHSIQFSQPVPAHQLSLPLKVSPSYHTTEHTFLCISFFLAYKSFFSYYKTTGHLSGMLIIAQLIIYFWRIVITNLCFHRVEDWTGSWISCPDVSKTDLKECRWQTRLSCYTRSAQLWKGSWTRNVSFL